MIKEAIAKVIEQQNLSEEEARGAMEVIMSGQATDAQIAAFITGLRMKGETVEEIAGCARVMRDKATPIVTKHPMVIDTCGTGGDGAHTFNISTTTAFVLAGAGLPVAKHGNRSVSSKSGSADVLEALGVNLNLNPETVSRCLDDIGIGFLFAPALHGAMKYAIGPRREIGVRTIFNILGPLTNPAGAQAQVIGVYNPALTEVLAGVLARLGVKRAFVIHGHGGLDEASLSGPTRVSEVVKGEVRTFEVKPGDLGLASAPLSALVGGTPQENAVITREVLSGRKNSRRNAVVLNSALGLVAGEQAEDLSEGIAIATRIIDSGAALAKLEQLITYSQAAAGA
ncbi:MAG: anthranilate phosphoribosyltransferase [Clostridia bacterium]|nr:anthranilate phosphoribosyltransferase [Clostridia bacterium]